MCRQAALSSYRKQRLGAAHLSGSFGPRRVPRGVAAAVAMRTRGRQAGEVGQAPSGAPRQQRPLPRSALSTDTALWPPQVWAGPGRSQLLSRTFLGCSCPCWTPRGRERLLPERPSPPRARQLREEVVGARLFYLRAVPAFPVFPPAFRPLAEPGRLR